jgi:hypothetical protein
MRNRFIGEEEDNEDYREPKEETPEDEFEDLYFFPLSDEDWHNESN